MLFNFALVYSFLFAFGALADRRRERRTSPFLNSLEEPTINAASSVQYSTNWAGAILQKDNGTFTTVTGTFTVPVPSGSNTSASVWVGIDGARVCPGALLQTGIDLKVSESNEVSYHAWYEWWPALSYLFDDLPINAGDVIQATVVALDATHGVATVDNLTQGQSKVAHLNSTHALCMQTAEWIVEDNADAQDNRYSFANFTPVTFTDNLASGPSGSFTPDGANISEIRQNNQTLTSVSIDGSDVMVQHT